MSRISTGTGDDGTTGLVGGARVPKTHPRIVATGAVDEANAAVGLAAAAVRSADVRATLEDLMADLFVVGADVASTADVPGALRIRAEDVARIERETDAREKELPPLRHFVLPGGSDGAARLHFARVVVRRAEREVWALAGREAVNREAMIFLNRASDLLFLLARAENATAGVAEIEWKGKEATGREGGRREDRAG